VEGGLVSDDFELVPDDVVMHRVGGASLENLSLRPAEVKLTPPGFSLLCGGAPGEAADAMRKQYPRMAPRGHTAVASTTAGQIRAAGFEVMKNATARFPQHGRLIHPDGVAGFTRENLEKLVDCFTETTGL
jgi:hypothetical protein